MDFYNILQQALLSSDILYKEESCNRLIEYCSTHKYIKSVEDFVPYVPNEPSYASFCQIVPPKKLPKRRDFKSKEGLAILLHSIAHIEYSAIDLAFDAVYRFANMPIEYKIDWLIVAQDEIRHYSMLCDILNSLGYRHGDFVVHKGLFDAMINTSNDILHRMAIIPRHYEATGLDVNPRIVQKLKPYSDIKEVQRTIEALDIIYTEEIEHVKKGDRWFKWVCNQRELDYESIFIDIIKQYRLNKNRDINVKARQKAGFSCSELKKLGAKECKEEDDI